MKVKLLNGEGLSERIIDYIRRADRLKENFDKAVAEDNIEKAGELLWGILACYLNALKIFLTGKPARRHGELVKVGYDLAKALGDDKILEGVRKAEKLHSNFYHAFLDKEDLKEIYEDVVYVVGRIYEMMF